MVVAENRSEVNRLNFTTRRDNITLRITVPLQRLSFRYIVEIIRARSGTSRYVKLPVIYVISSTFFIARFFLTCLRVAFEVTLPLTFVILFLRPITLLDNKRASR